MQDYDLVIIGTGSGKMVLQAAMESWRIAIVERSTTFGGTCLNVGCIPSKMFVRTAELAYDARDAARFGIDAEVRDVHWRAIRDRIFGRIDPIGRDARDDLSARDNIDVYTAHARFIGPRTLSLSTGETITGKRIVVATGSSVVLPDVLARSDAVIHTSDTIMRLDELPARVVIIGGGYIAAEFAHVFSALGAQVHVVVRDTQMLTGLDHDISAAFSVEAGQRWRLHWRATVAAVDKTRTGAKVRLHDGTEIEADVVLAATGRRPNTDDLDPDAAGLSRHPDGRLVVDEFQRTSVEDVWALGDVSSPWMLKHVANHDAKVVAHNVLTPHDLIANRRLAVPSAVFSHPEIASVGLTEQRARAQGRDIQVLRHDYRDVAYGWALEETTGFAKVIADARSGQLLGAHIIGAQAATLIQPLVQAMTFGQTAPAVARGQYWIHPALTEIVENTLLHFEERG